MAERLRYKSRRLTSKSARSRSYSRRSKSQSLGTRSGWSSRSRICKMNCQRLRLASARQRSRSRLSLSPRERHSNKRRVVTTRRLLLWRRRRQCLSRGFWMNKWAGKVISARWSMKLTISRNRMFRSKNSCRLNGKCFQVKLKSTRCSLSNWRKSTVTYKTLASETELFSRAKFNSLSSSENKPRQTCKRRARSLRPLWSRCPSGVPSRKTEPKTVKISSFLPWSSSSRSSWRSKLRLIWN